MPATCDRQERYDRLCEITQQRYDPCCLDVFHCAIAQARDLEPPNTQRKRQAATQHA